MIMVTDLKIHMLMKGLIMKDKAFYILAFTFLLSLFFYRQESHKDEYTIRKAFDDKCKLAGGEVISISEGFTNLACVKILFKEYDK